MNWNEHDLKVVEMREKIIYLTSQFDQDNGTEIPDYHIRLNQFLDRHLKKESDSLLKEHFDLTVSTLFSQKQNI